MREDQKQPWEEIKAWMIDGKDTPEVCQSATEFRRVRQWEPVRCWSMARQMHSVKPWGAISQQPNGAVTWSVEGKRAEIIESIYNTPSIDTTR